MGQCEIRPQDDADGLVAAAADDFFGCLTDAHEEGQRIYSVALSGGRVAGPFCEAIGERVGPESALKSILHFFWADERCVEPTDPNSNFRVARESLFNPFQIVDDQIHRIPGELTPADAALKAESELKELLGAKAGGSIPQVDFVFLGMGEDGHIASLFPEETEGLPGALYKPVRASKPPPDRISMTFDLLKEAKEVRVLIPGDAKKEALLAALGGAANPLGELIELRQDTIIYTDIRLG